MIVLILLTAVSLLVTLVLAWRTRRFLGRAARASGRIKSVTMESHEWPGYGSDHPAETTRLYTSRVEFSPKEGSLIEFQSRVSHTGTPIYKEGDVVTVVYEPASPEATAEIAGPAVWQSAVFAGLAAFLLLCVTVGEKACG